MSQRENIIEHAMNMFVSQGIKAVRMDDIARELSISKRTLYELFGDKEELLYQSIICFTRMGNEKRQEQIKHIDNRLEVMIFALRDMITQTPIASRLRRNMQRFYPSVYKRLEDDLTAQHRENMRMWIKHCVKDGYLTATADSDYVLKILIDSTQGIMYADSFDAHETQDMVAYISYAIVIFIRGLCTPKGIEVIDSTFNKYFGNIQVSSTL